MSELERSFRIFPIPSACLFQLEVNLPQANELEVRVSNVLGQEGYRNLAGKQTGLYREEIDLRNLAKGTYLLEFTSGSQKIFRKLMVQ